MRKKIFFDLDGTLLDSRQRLYQLFCKMVDENVLSFDAYWELKRNKTDHASILKNQFRWNDTAIVEFQSEWMQLIEKPEWLALDKVFEGVYTVINQLFSACDLYLFTARQSEKMALQQLSDLNLIDYFKKIFVTQQKTDKETLFTQSQLYIQPSDITIGDTGVDVNLGKKMGCVSIAVTSGFCSKKVLEAYQPDFILNSVCDPLFLQISLSHSV